MKKSKRSGVRYSSVESQFILDHYLTLGVEEVARRLERTPRSIIQAYCRLYTKQISEKIEREKKPKGDEQIWIEGREWEERKIESLNPYTFSQLSREEKWIYKQLEKEK